MADSNAVNPQITDAVTQTTVKVIAESPSTALGVVYQLLSQSVGLAMQNSTSHQHSMQQVSTATTTAAVQQILYAGSRFQIAPIVPPPPPPAPPPPPPSQTVVPVPVPVPASSAGSGSQPAASGTGSGSQQTGTTGTSGTSQQTGTSSTAASTGTNSGSTSTGTTGTNPSAK